jgi:hypothetical protein
MNESPDNRLMLLLVELESGDAASTATALEETTVQRLMTVATKLYVAKLEQGAEFPPFSVAGGSAAVTATEAVETASRMLDALNLEVFELGMWRARGGVAQR